MVAALAVRATNGPMAWKELLSKIARAFGRAFLVGIMVYLPGLAAAPNLGDAYGVGVAALAAGVAAGLAAISVFVPLLSTGYEVLDQGIQAGLAFFIANLVGLLNGPELNFTRSAITGLIAGALAAAVRAIQEVITRQPQPVPQVGKPGPTNTPRKPSR